MQYTNILSKAQLQLANIDNINDLRVISTGKIERVKELNSRKHNIKISDTYSKKPADVPRIAVY